MKLKINLILFLFVCTYSYGQMDEYNYTQELQGVTDQWHKIVLPNELFSKVTPQLSDLRIYGITAAKDTIEAPYLLRVSKEKTTRKEVLFKTINRTSTNKGYYYTFKIPKKEAINQIRLNLGQDNFDWRLNLEGSHNQQKWFRILTDYRILSIKNEQTNYQFTKVIFPAAKYHYLRLLIKSKKKPQLKSAKITYDSISQATLRNYTLKTVIINEKKPVKQTVIDVHLEEPVPVSMLNIDVKTTFDYFRPITIKYVTDSIKTEQGWHYNYNTLFTGTLSSFEENTFTFNSTILQKLKIIIRNHDNEPLQINTLSAKGYTHELIARFTKPATYYLTYGNTNAHKPNYDLNHSKTTIPEQLTSLSLKKRQPIDKKESKAIEPLFKNKAWLWGIMVLIILVLGWFTLKMIQKK